MLWMVHGKKSICLKGDKLHPTISTLLFPSWRQSYRNPAEDDPLEFHGRAAIKKHELSLNMQA